MTSSRRYNLRRKPGRTYPRRVRRKPSRTCPRSKNAPVNSLEDTKTNVGSTNQHLSADGASAEAASASVTLPSADSRLLYQVPRKWTLDHLRVANVKQKLDVPLDEIVDAIYIPTDDDPDFKRIANQFQDEVVEETHTDINPKNIGDTANPFYFYLNDFRRRKWDCYMQSYIGNFRLPGTILRQMYPDCSLALKMNGRLPLSIAALKAGKGVCVDGSVLRISEATDEMGVPLCVVLRKQEPGELGIAKYEIPQLLLQANMIFNYDKNLEKYEAFLISVENYTYTIIRAIASPEYLASIRAGGPASGTFQTLRSRSFDIIDRETRKEFLRSFMSLGRYFVHRPEFSFPMRKYRPVG